MARLDRGPGHGEKRKERRFPPKKLYAGRKQGNCSTGGHHWRLAKEMAATTSFDTKEAKGEREVPTINSAQHGKQ